MLWALLRSAVWPALMLALAACSSSGTEGILPPADPSSSFTGSIGAGDQYRLGPGDKLSIIVFGEQELSGEFAVGSGGEVDLPLIGGVSAQGATVGEFQERVVARFKAGYLKDPKISVSVLNYRPFFISGEVKNGGEYPYKAGLTVQDAVAVAGGYTYRANTGRVYIRRAGQDVEVPVDLDQRVPVSPGDNIRVPERFF